MARPRKTNADYFSHDTDMRNDLRVKAVRRKFGLTGYAVWNMLLEVMTDCDNLKLEYNDEQLELISADFDVDVSDLKMIIEYFIQLKLIVCDDGVIYSETLLKRLESLFQKREKQLSTSKTQNLGVSATETQKNEVFDSENRHSKVKESKVKESKEKEIKVNTYSDAETVYFSETDLCIELMEYFGFTEMRNPDKLQTVFYFLNILNTDGKIDLFKEQFTSYKTYKEKSNTARHSFPRFLGTIETRYMDGGWNQENWSDRLEGFNSNVQKQTGENLAEYNSRMKESLKQTIYGTA